ncbi:MAG: hypothetical protein ACI8ZF_000559 [Candidatus Midichloriaceae bacterium]|jgi:hypothetical protein
MPIPTTDISFSSIKTKYEDGPKRKKSKLRHSSNT